MAAQPASCNVATQAFDSLAKLSDFRSRKSVDYSKLVNRHDDDEDFADATPPQKKPKKDNINLKKEKESAKPRKKDDRKKRVESRVSPGEKLFENELQVALQLSMSPAVARREPQPPLLQKPPVLETVAVVSHEQSDLLAAERSPPVLSPHHIMDSNISPLRTNSKPAEDPDMIVIIEEDVDIDSPQKGRRPRRRSATKPNKYASDSDEENNAKNDGDDDDFKVVDGDASSDSDTVGASASDAEDSDFDAWDGGGKKRKKTAPATARGRTKVPAPASNTEKSKNQTKIAKKTPTGRGNGSSVGRCAVTPPAASHTPVRGGGPLKCGGGSEMPTGGSLSSLTKAHVPLASPTVKTAWKPPAPCGTSSSAGLTGVKSPSGGLRLGLSKFGRFKPLHPAAKPH